MDWTIIVSVYTVLAFYVAWTAFYIDRLNKKQQRKEEKTDILISIERELELMNIWLGTSYSDANYEIKQDPWHPFHMVYGLGNNDAIKNAISLKSVSLLSENFLRALVSLNQKLGSFEQHVDRLIEFNSSEPVIATKSFYYYDSNFSQFDRAGKWAEFEKLAKKLSSGRRLTREQIHLIGSVRILKDLHIFGIGSEENNTSLRYSYCLVKNLIKEEFYRLDAERRFKQSPFFVFLDTIVFGSILLGLYFLIHFFLKGGVISINMNFEWARIILEVVVAGVAVWGIIEERKLKQLRVLFGVIRGWSKQVQSASNSNSVILDKIRKGVLKRPKEIEAALDAQGSYLYGLHVSFQEELKLADEILNHKS